MRFNHLLSFLPVTFSLAFLPALLLSVLLPHCFPTIICPVEIIYLSLLLPAFFAFTTVKLQLAPHLLFSILFFPHFSLSVLLPASLPCFSHAFYFQPYYLLLRAHGSDAC